MFYTYILYSEILNNYYVGFTTISVESRLKKHLVSKKGFTSRTKDWKIIYVEKFDKKQDAAAREKEIKSWKSKIKIEKLIQRSTE